MAEKCMKNKYDKYYFEEYALLAICHLLNLDFQNFEHLDKPDLQSQAFDMGVEVVRAITEQDGLINFLVNSHFGKGRSGEEIVAEINKDNAKGKLKAAVYTIEGTAVISKGVYDSSKHQCLVAERIEKKAQLLRKNYKLYKTNGLYCFTQTSLINEIDYPFLLESCKKSPFSVIFIDCINTILQWNAPADDFIEHKIASNYLSEWNQTAFKNSDKRS